MCELPQLTAGQRALCVDMQSPWLEVNEAEGTGQPFFNEAADGSLQLAPKVAEIFQYLNEMEASRPLLDKAVQALVSGLLLSKVDYTTREGHTLENCFTFRLWSVVCCSPKLITPPVKAIPWKTASP